MADSQLKTKHHFNGFDVFMIICILAVVAIALIYFVSPIIFGNKTSNGETVDIIYRLRADDVLNDIHLNMKQGNQLFEIVRADAIGTIEDISVEPMKYIGRNTLEGSLTQSVLPNRKTIWLTVSTEATIQDDKYYIGEQEISVGSALTVRTNGFTGYMTIAAIEEVKIDE